MAWYEFALVDPDVDWDVEIDLNVGEYYIAEFEKSVSIDSVAVVAWDYFDLMTEDC